MILTEWTIKYGDKEMLVTADDIVETLGRAASIVLKEAETNPHIKSDPRMKIIYEIDVERLALLKNNFSAASEDMKKRHPRGMVPGGQKK